MATNIAGESDRIRIRVLEGELELAGDVGLVSDFERLGGAGDVEVVLAAGAVVAPAVSTAAAGVAAEYAARVGGGGEE